MTLSDPLHSELVETIARLRELQAKATPGPYRAHDHNDMARLGEDPEKWMGYAWVGRITKQSEPDGRFDAGWLDRDSRKDASKEYRERASADAHFVAEALNALPALLDVIERLTSAPAGYAIVPHKPTEAMLQAIEDYRGDDLDELWSAMLSAAPSTPTATGDGWNFDLNEAPKDGERFIAAWECRETGAVCVSADVYCCPTTHAYFSADDGLLTSLLAWQPLPQAPTGDQP